MEYIDAPGELLQDAGHLEKHTIAPVMLVGLS